MSLLNSIRRPLVGKTFYHQDNNIISAMKAASLAEYNSWAWENNGPLKALCLRVEFGTKPPPGSWQPGIDPDLTDLYWISIKARIPSLHRHFLNPNAAPTFAATQADHSTIAINMHPTYVSSAPVKQGSLGQGPSPGDIVYVDYGDRVNLSQPIYLGKVAAGQIVTPIGGAMSSFHRTDKPPPGGWSPTTSYTSPDAFGTTGPDDLRCQLGTKAQCYENVLKEVNPNRPKYKPRWDTIKGYNTGKRQTFCNWYVNDVVLSMGLMDQWVPQANAGGGWGPRPKYSVNEMVRWLLSDGGAKGWIQADSSKGIEMAKKGFPVIAAYYNPGRTGHIEMLRPDGNTAGAGASPGLSKPLSSLLTQFFYHPVD